MSMNVHWPDLSSIASSFRDETTISTYDSPCQSLAAPSALTNPVSSYAASSSVADVLSEEDDDMEVLSWVTSGRLPANCQTALALNQAYQEILQQSIRKAESLLLQTRDLEQAIQPNLDKKITVKSKSSNKVPLQLYIHPYFKDSSCMCPPLNVDAVAKHADRNDFDMLVEPPSKWTKIERKRLEMAIKSNVVEKRVRTLIQRRENLLDGTSKKEDVDVQEQIKILTREIEVIKRTENVDLTNVDKEVDWVQVSVQDMSSLRSPIECRLAWINEFSPAVNQNVKWSKEELATLKKLAVTYKGRMWNEVAAKLGTGRTPFQCAEKFQTELNENIKKKKWTAEEEAELLDAVRKVRSGEFIPWDQVVVFLDGRTRDQCLQRWRRSLNPRIQHGRWNEQEDMQLIKAVHKLGVGDWEKVAKCVPTRSEPQCRERWTTSLSPDVVHAPWTKEEDAKLLLGVNTFGVGKWVQIQALVGGRTAAMCKMRYRTLKRHGLTNVTKIEPGTENVEDKVNICRRKRQIERKERVRQAFLAENGSLPTNKRKGSNVRQRPSALNDLPAFLTTLPKEIRNVIRHKLDVIEKTFGVIDGTRIPTDTPFRRIGFEKPAPAEDPERLNNVDQEIMAFLRNSTAPTVNAYPCARNPSKEAAMARTLYECLNNRKILPPTKSTLMGFKGLVLEQGDLTSVAEHLSFVNPLIKTSDFVPRGYLEEKDDSFEIVATSTHEKPTTSKLSEDLVPAAVYEAVTSSTTFKEAEEIFRCVFLWPATLYAFHEGDEST